MEFTFDVRGYLKPYGKNTIEATDLKTGFVDTFDEDSTRMRLYDGYMNYNSDLKILLNNQKYLQWIDGSFISTQTNPNDIDLVSLIDYRLIDAHQEELKRFITQQGRDEYGIDGYIIKIYPENHKNYIRTQSDLLYWENWFSMSRRNRRKQRLPKGFVELEF